MDKGLSAEGTHSPVTLESLQMMPSHFESQGSSDVSQLGGVCCHSPFRERSTATEDSITFISDPKIWLTLANGYALNVCPMITFFF